MRSFIFVLLSLSIYSAHSMSIKCEIEPNAYNETATFYVEFSEGTNIPGEFEIFAHITNFESNTSEYSYEEPESVVIGPRFKYIEEYGDVEERVYVFDIKVDGVNWGWNTREMTMTFDWNKKSLKGEGFINLKYEKNLRVTCEDVIL